MYNVCNGLQLRRFLWSFFVFFAIKRFCFDVVDGHHSFLAHLSRRLMVSLYYTSRAGVCVCVCVLTFSNMNISETNGPIATKFYLKHHWVGGKEALCF